MGNRSRDPRAQASDPDNRAPARPATRVTTSDQPAAPRTPAASTSPTAPETSARLHSPRPGRAGIGDIMAGVRLSPRAAPPGAGEPAEPRHPIGSGIAFERVENVYRMDPRRVVLEGKYVRQFVEDSAFEQLRAAVALERDIGQHLGVRIVGPPTNQRRVLVYGMRRWKAAIAVGLDKVPVRDYGAIPEEKALELQMLENEIRADPHPVDTAFGFFMLTRQAEWPQKRIAEVFDKNKGYVSEMVRVGEAIARLREVDREPLYTCPRVTVRAFQTIAPLKSVEDRKDALLALVTADATSTAASGSHPRTTSLGAGAPARRIERDDHRRDDERALFHARTVRDGRSFRVRWTDSDIRRDGPQVAEELKARLLDEYTRLLERTAALGALSAAGSAATPDIASLVATAVKDAAQIDARIASHHGRPAAPKSEHRE